MTRKRTIRHPVLMMMLNKTIYCDSRPLPVLWGAGTSGRTATALTARF
jgi:hypothetical protein